MRRKPRKTLSKFYRGVYIERNGAYSAPYDTFKTIAFLPDIEGYFKSIGKARAYIDSNYEAILKEQNKPRPGKDGAQFILSLDEGLKECPFDHPSGDNNPRVNGYCCEFWEYYCCEIF